MSRWIKATKFDVDCAALADKHYSRRTIGSPQFMPPGETVVLKAPGALFGWWRPHPDSGLKSMNGLDGWTCSIFRNESDALSSELVLEAEYMLTEIKGNNCGPSGLITYVWDKRVRSSNPGCCFKKAGWSRTGKSADKRKTLFQKPFALAGLLVLAACSNVYEPRTGTDTFVDGTDADAGVEVSGTPAIEGLYGLPTTYCHATRVCTKQKISKLSVGRGSDLPNSPSKMALAGALWFRFAGNGEWNFCDPDARTAENYPHGDGWARAGNPDCVGGGDEAWLGPTTWTADGRFKQADIVVNSLIHIRTYHEPSSDVAIYVYDVCGSGWQDVTVEFTGRHSSSDDVIVCHGG